MNQKVLVVGPPGSGKTYVSEKLKANGINAWDADLIKGLCKWVDSQGNTVTFPDNAGHEWLHTHRFVWDKNFLNNWLELQKPVYVFGLSSNVYEMKDLFDKIFFLEINKDALKKRLDNPERKNPMGKTEEQKQSISDSMQRNKERSVNIGASVIDGTLPPDQIYQIISQ